MTLSGRVTLLAADAVEQVKSHAEPYFLAGSALWNQLQDLATLVAVATPPRSDDGISLFCSSGLAGTEVLAAAYLLERYRLARQ